MNKNIKTLSAHGFTLIELMIVLAMAAVMAAIALPNLNQFIANNRLKSQMYSMLESINIARNEAVKRKVKTVMCRTTNFTACGGTTKTWTTGWIVYAKGNTTDAYNSATDTIIGIGNAADSNVTVMSDANAKDYVIYKTDGTIGKTSNNSFDGNSQLVFAICDERGIDYGKQISIMPVGRASITSNPITNCTP